MGLAVPHRSHERASAGVVVPAAVREGARRIHLDDAAVRAARPEAEGAHPGADDRSLLGEEPGHADRRGARGRPQIPGGPRAADPPPGLAVRALEGPARDYRRLSTGKARGE